MPLSRQKKLNYVHQIRPLQVAPYQQPVSAGKLALVFCATLNGNCIFVYRGNLVIMNDRDRAIIWARETMEKDFVVLDFETTGLQVEGPNPDEAVSLGLVSKSRKTLMDTLLCHSKRSSPDALRVHGHTWEETRKAPRLPAVWDEFKSHIDGKQILCYCVNNFDSKILVNICFAHGVPTLDLSRRTIQALGPFAMFYGDYDEYHGNYRWKRLTFAANFFGIPTEGAHGSAADCLMTLRVVEAMAEWELSEEK